MKIKLFLLVSFFVFALQYGYSSTIVSGGIYSNTTWTLTNSPYIVTDTVVVFPGVTLSIDPGVVIQFDDSVLLEVRGILNAIGNSIDSITFTSNSPTPHKGSWQGIFFNTQLGANADMRFVKMSYAEYPVNVGFSGYGHIAISRDQFYQNLGCITGSPYQTNLTVDSCLFIYNDAGIGYLSSGIANFTVTNSRFINNDYGFSYSENVNAINCIFCGNNIAIWAWDGTFTNCIIMHNGIGIKHANVYALNLDGLTIAYNDTGLVLCSTVPDNITQCSICHNNVYNVVHTGSYNCNMTNICWCDTVPANISQKIYDGYDNINYGLINFTPFTNCNTNSIPNGSVPCFAITGIEDQPAAAFAYIYPNPFTTQATLKISSDVQLKNTQLEIFDLMGNKVRVITEINSSEITIERNDMAPGIYFYRLLSKDKIIGSGKLIAE